MSGAAVRGAETVDGAQQLLAEIREQPAAWRRLLEHERELADIGRRLADGAPSLVRIVAHGTSNHASLYATYALRLLCGWTVVRDSMSLPLAYGAPSAAPGEVAIGLSQSGQTRDVVAWLERARAAGATTVAVTNERDSALAGHATEVVLMHAGTERSVAATKTYTCMLAALALIGAHAAGPQRGAELSAALRETADRAEAALPGLERDVEAVAAALARVERLYAVARGVELATAAETALKVTEVAYVSATGMTATEMAHGPVAALDGALPVWAVASDEATLPSVAEAVARARAAGAPVVVAGPLADRVEGATHALPHPGAPDPLLSPLLSVLPGQLFSRALALEKGIDPGAPRHIRKVTIAA